MEKKKIASDKLLYRELTEKVIGAAMEVHKVLGPGFLESVYEEALAHELQMKGILFERQKPLPVYYKGKKLKDFTCDFFIENKLLVELKAMKALTPQDEAQLVNYLKATQTRIGILFNFGEPSLKFKRMIL